MEIKQFDGPARNPESQFQIGDRVIYLPEGIYTLVDGYRWVEVLGSVARIAAYRLACGIDVPENTLARVDRQRVKSSLSPPHTI